MSIEFFIAFKTQYC